MLYFQRVCEYLCVASLQKLKLRNQRVQDQLKVSAMLGQLFVVSSPFPRQADQF